MPQTKNKKIQNIFFSTLLLASFILLLILFKPYISIIITAGALAIVFRPFYSKILKFCKKKKTIASLVSVILIALIILGPLFLIGYQVYKEASSLYLGLSGNNFSQFNNLINQIEKTAQKLSPGFSLNIDAQQILSPVLSFTVKHLGDIFSGAAKFLIALTLGLITLFYFFREGSAIKQYFFILSPLSATNDQEIFTALKKTINASIKGGLFVAVLQGIAIGIGFWAFGLPNGALWGSVAMITSFVPGIGLALIIIPAAIYLLFASKFIMVLAFLIWTLGINAVLDYLVSPKLKKGAELHPLLILFSVLGGISWFGPMGIIIGPMIVSFFAVLLKIYPEIKKTTIRAS
ncbi:MAG: AI-2E family transporter [Candidatus Pacebacteria bacterium]|nr:AI-2E family transporter [Candidatus Paceibacterota bacterium]